MLIQTHHNSHPLLLPFKAVFDVEHQTRADASSAQPDPSHTVSRGRYLRFEWPAARVQPREP
jgi:hypothetical protein